MDAVAGGLDRLHGRHNFPVRRKARPVADVLAGQCPLLEVLLGALRALHVQTAGSALLGGRTGRHLQHEGTAQGATRHPNHAPLRKEVQEGQGRADLPVGHWSSRVVCLPPITTVLTQLRLGFGLRNKLL